MSKTLIQATFLAFLILTGCTNGSKPAAGDPFISMAVSQVSQENIIGYINDLVNFNTRHTMSTQTDPSQGIGAAVNYLKEKCEAWTKDTPGAKVEIYSSEAGGAAMRMDRTVSVPNVMVTLPGTEGSREILLLAHIDTRVFDLADSTSFAPGANDDGSGLACLLEVTRILAQKPLRQTVKCIFVSGEEQSLIGSAHMAAVAKQEGWPIMAVINNDMIGNATASGTGLTTTSMVRLFSDSPRGEDSNARQLARYIRETAQTYVPGHEVKLMYRSDRYRRSGDQVSFLNQGFTAVRMSEYYENYDRTHQNVREEDGIAYGDLISGVDIPYLQRNIQVNLASVMNLAQAPAAPARARIANVNALSNATILEWTAVPEEGATYQVLYRETDQPEWQIYADCPSSSENTLSYEIPLSKDNYFYAVRSVSAGGHPSLPVVCR